MREIINKVQTTLFGKSSLREIINKVQTTLFVQQSHTTVSGPNKAYMAHMGTISKELKLINIQFNVVIMAQEYQAYGFEAVFII